MSGEGGSYIRQPDGKLELVSRTGPAKSREEQLADAEAADAEVAAKPVKSAGKVKKDNAVD